MGMTTKETKKKQKAGLGKLFKGDGCFRKVQVGYSGMEIGIKYRQDSEELIPTSVLG